MTRIVTGAVLGAGAVGAILGLSSLWILVLGLGAFLVAASELGQIARASARGGPVWHIPLLVAGMAIALVSVAGSEGDRGPELAAGIAIWTLLPLLSTLLLRTPLDRAPRIAGWVAVGVPYLAVPLVAMHQLHRLDRTLLLVVVLVVAAGDTSAYYGGRLLGKHRLAPKVSPKKTWEGSFCGLLTACLVGAAWSWWEMASLDPSVVGLCALTSVAGQAGDLVESMLKRSAGMKDSGRVLPGHGGVLDRIDALLFAAPAFLLGILIAGPEHFLPSRGL